MGLALSRCISDSEDRGRAVGRALCRYLQPQQVVVGRDMRLSSPSVCEALIEGLRAQQVDVIDLGMVSTDQYYHWPLYTSPSPRH